MHTTHAVMQVDASLKQGAHQDAGSVPRVYHGLVGNMASLGGIGNQSMRTPVPRGTGRNLQYKDQLRPSEVVAALPDI